ncbi:13992_t:CDS:2, partial [Entrophospora sp. SA101]
DRDDGINKDVISQNHFLFVAPVQEVMKDNDIITNSDENERSTLPHLSIEYVGNYDIESNMELLNDLVVEETDN